MPRPRRDTGGTYVLSARAAASMVACPRGNWSTCPNAHFNDTKSPSVSHSQRRSCFSNSTSYNDDLFTGACMAEAPGRLIAQSHPCFQSTHWSVMWIHKVWRGGVNCTCPASVHSIKGDALEMLRVRRAVQRRCGYVGAESS